MDQDYLKTKLLDNKPLSLFKLEMTTIKIDHQEEITSLLKSQPLKMNQKKLKLKLLIMTMDHTMLTMKLTTSALLKLTFSLKMIRERMFQSEDHHTRLHSLRKLQPITIT